MLNQCMTVAAALVIAFAAGTLVGQEQREKPMPENNPAYVLDHTLNLIDGTSESLSKYQGKVVLIVNVASKCGLTPQYEGLEKLYREKEPEGLVILGFPANNFGGQEPGSNQEIAEFCTATYDVSFPMFEKIDVIGDNQHPLYQDLCSQPEPIGIAPNWNFTKYLVDRSGNVVMRFDPRTAPTDAELIRAVDVVLGQPVED